MAGVIYLVTHDGLVPMEPARYDLEDVLQRLLAGDARLLGGASSGDAASRRWILVKREAPVHGASGQSWSADHLFVDDEAVPTVVEVKRSANTQLRREVVGQLLEYAANLASTMTADDMRRSFETTVLATGSDPHEHLQAQLHVDATSDEFWGRVADNLATARVRGYIVADAIPEEVRRIVDLLNRQIGDARYLALEVPQFRTADGSGVALVPQIVAGSLEPPKAAAGRESRAWTEESVIAAIREQGSQAAADAAAAILEWAHERGLRVQPGRGAEYGTLTIFVPRSDQPRIVRVWVPGSLELQVAASKPPLDEPETRADLMRRFTAIPGIQWTRGAPPADTDRWPGVWLAPFADHSRRASLLRVFDSMVEAYQNGAVMGASKPT